MCPGELFKRKGRKGAEVTEVVNCSGSDAAGQSLLVFIPARAGDIRSPALAEALRTQGVTNMTVVKNFASFAPWRE
jgi:hypothetical protein